LWYRRRCVRDARLPLVGSRCDPSPGRHASPPRQAVVRASRGPCGETYHKRTHVRAQVTCASRCVFTASSAADKSEFSVPCTGGTARQASTVIPTCDTRLAKGYAAELQKQDARFLSYNAQNNFPCAHSFSSGRRSRSLDEHWCRSSPSRL